MSLNLIQFEYLKLHSTKTRFFEYIFLKNPLPYEEYENFIHFK